MTIGRHFALVTADENLLREVRDEDRADWIGNEIEERYLEPWFCDSDKAWDAIHRAFDNSALSYDASTPLKGVILGGEPLYFEGDYILSFKSSAYVKQIADALAAVSAESFRKLYFAIDDSQYGCPVDEEDFLYSLNWLEKLKSFYSTAASDGRSVIFTASQ